jgi:YfiH family protein
MPFVTLGALRAYTFESLQESGVKHAVFTRHGGVSPAPWRSLNVGGSVGDVPECVATNRRRIFEAMGRPEPSLANVWQVHSGRVVEIERPNFGAPPEKADAMVTNRPGVTLMMRFADCVPILAYDPKRLAVGMAHAGWRGTLNGVAQNLVATLVHSFGCRPEDLMVGIGPSIAAHHYPVGPEVVQAVRRFFGQVSEPWLEPVNGEVRFDLWAANRWLLEREGVMQVEISGVCTACHPEDWYSHRAEAGKTGRFGALMYLAA